MREDGRHIHENVGKHAHVLAGLWPFMEMSDGNVEIGF